jgi:hypothetical protein
VSTSAVVAAGAPVAAVAVDVSKTADADKEAAKDLKIDP